MEPLFVGEEWPSLAQKKATLQRARKHALLSELSPAELGQQGRFVFVDLGSRAFKSSTEDFLSHYPLASRFEIHAFGAPAADCTARAPAAHCLQRTAPPGRLACNWCFTPPAPPQTWTASTLSSGGAARTTARTAAARVRSPRRARASRIATRYAVATSIGVDLGSGSELGFVVRIRVRCALRAPLPNSNPGPNQVATVAVGGAQAMKHLGSAAYTGHAAATEEGTEQVGWSAGRLG